MGRLLLIIVFLFVIVVGLLAAAPFFIPTDVYRTQIISAVKEATGRDLKLDGEFNVSFLPPVSFTASEVSLSNAPWASEPDMLRVKTITASISVIPFLFNNKVQVNSFVLDGPEIHLEADQNGRANWEFETGTVTTSTEPETEETATTAATQDTSSAPVQFGDVSLGDVRLDNGLITYKDQKTGETTRAENINVKVTLPSLDGPLGVDGGVRYNEEDLELKVAVDRPRNYIDGQLTPVAIGVASALVKLDFDGQAASRSGNLPLKGTGKLDLDVPSVRKLAAWAGSPLDGDTGFGPMMVKGNVKAEGDVLSVEDADLTFDEIKGKGQFGLDMATTKPKLTGTLDVDKLDIRPYEPAPADPSQASAEPKVQKVAQTSQVAQEGWSDEPMDFSALGTVNADLKLTANEILTSSMKTGRSELDVVINESVLTADLKDMQLYEGAGKMKLTVDARSPEAKITNEMTFSAIQAKGLVQDMMQAGLLEGVGDFALKFTTSGRSQKDLIAALNGDGALKFLNGAVYGINLAQIVRNLGDAMEDPLKALQNPKSFILGSRDGEQQKTDFAEMVSTFTIKNGVLNTDDFNLLNPLLRVPGKKGTNILEQTVNFALTPKVVATLKGQGGKDLNGLTIPLRVTGTWSNMSVGLDPDALKDVTKNQGRKLLDGLIGGKKKDDGDGDSDGDTPGGELIDGAADKLIDGLFGKKKDPE